ncbi:Co-chaperone protein HscB [Buchnera aphidicola (Cinara kochiana kochiana)]|uniref:Co-chaperone protein HscB n=1 Tax=Buchnera aphidicola (Cinara kochiana kochiana) TaxID=2518976 RepID=A0A451D6F9_9GAMM|nr:Fe-S protein assembly co-chaperone HscB [Buchnera aphidicola]VFP81294.1 Co-chaperone protein HscB [Buchnera aphidicola (Cinara kochiana kochiana)]
MNYFNLFQIPQKFNIDKNKLINNFYELQKKYHPDNCDKNHLNENKKILISIQINKGFNILKNKFTRANHLLEINKKKYKIKEKYIFNKKKTLIEKFQLYEEIQKIKNQSNSFTKINIFIKNIKIKLNLYFLEFNKKIKEKKINSADQVYGHICFIYKILKKAQNLKNTLTNE